MNQDESTPISETVLSKSTSGIGLYPISDIYISPDRMREDNPATRRYIDEELAPSIVDNGLIQPVVLNIPSTPITAQGQEYTAEIIAGWCRLTSFKSLGIDSIPYTTRDNLSDDAKLELELEENLTRRNMTWQENCKAIHTIHQQKVALEKSKGKKWGYRQTGQLLGGVSHGHVSDTLKVAKHLLKGDEEVASASSMFNAMKIIMGRKEDEIIQALSDAALPAPKRTPSMEPARPTSGIDPTAVALGSSSEPTIETSMPEMKQVDLSEMLFHMDNREWFEKQEDESIDLIYTDIPYGIDMNNLDFGAEDLDRVADAHDVEENVEQMAGFLKNAYRVLKDKKYLFFWYDIKHQEKLHQWGLDAGFKVQPYPLVWCKEHPCRNRAGGKWFTKNIEYVMVMRKGTATLREAKTSCWFPADGSAERKSQRNPFSKPFAISKQIIEAVAIPGDVMLDCYAGEGSLVRCALTMGLQIRAVEKSDQHFPRLQEHVKQLISQMTRDQAEFV